MTCACPDFDPDEFDGPEDHAAACAGCPVHGTAIEVTEVHTMEDAEPLAVSVDATCNCEHESHETGQAHTYLGVPANPDRVAMHVGPVCDDCADGHLAGYMRHCDRCGSSDHWTEDHPDDPELTLPEQIEAARAALVEHQAGSHDGMTRCLDAILSVLDDLTAEVEALAEMVRDAQPEHGEVVEP